MLTIGASGADTVAATCQSGVAAPAGVAAVVATASGTAAAAVSTRTRRKGPMITQNSRSIPHKMDSRQHYFTIRTGGVRDHARLAGLPVAAGGRG